MPANTATTFFRYFSTHCSRFARVAMIKIIFFLCLSFYGSLLCFIHWSSSYGCGHRNSPQYSNKLNLKLTKNKKKTKDFFSRSAGQLQMFISIRKLIDFFSSSSFDFIVVLRVRLPKKCRRSTLVVYARYVIDT